MVPQSPQTDESISALETLCQAQQDAAQHIGAVVLQETLVRRLLIKSQRALRPLEKGNTPEHKQLRRLQEKQAKRIRERDLLKPSSVVKLGQREREIRRLEGFIKARELEARHQQLYYQEYLHQVEQHKQNIEKQEGLLIDWPVTTFRPWWRERSSTRKSAHWEISSQHTVERYLSGKGNLPRALREDVQAKMQAGKPVGLSLCLYDSLKDLYQILYLSPVLDHGTPSLRDRLNGLVSYANHHNVVFSDSLSSVLTEIIDVTKAQYPQIYKTHQKTLEGNVKAACYMSKNMLRYPGGADKIDKVELSTFPGNEKVYQEQYRYTVKKAQPSRRTKSKIKKAMNEIRKEAESLANDSLALAHMLKTVSGSGYQLADASQFYQNKKIREQLKKREKKIGKIAKKKEALLKIIAENPLVAEGIEQDYEAICEGPWDELLHSCDSMWRNLLQGMPDARYHWEGFQARMQRVEEVVSLYPAAPPAQGFQPQYHRRQKDLQEPPRDRQQDYYPTAAQRSSYGYQPK